MRNVDISIRTNLNDSIREKIIPIHVRTKTHTQILTNLFVVYFTLLYTEG